MRWVVIGAVAALLAGTGVARAADTLAFADPPAWVRPAPPVDPTAQKPGEKSPMLLVDLQVRAATEGDSTYQERVFQIRNAFDLQSVGTLRLAWDPSRDSIVVHKVRVRRDGQVIDVLKRQSFEVIRLEPDVEEIVTGNLSAHLQPEDLRVGDVIEFAYTLTHKDPVLKGHSDVEMPVFSGGAIHVRAVLPPTGPTQWRVGDRLPRPELTKGRDARELILALDGPEPKSFPFDAPRRLRPLSDLQISGFASWTEVSALMSPMFQAAATLAPDSPLKAEAARIRAEYSDPKARAAAALRLVQDKVRYLGRTLTDGGYTPVAADKTWERKYGECKAKTVLLIALLHELGIEAEPVLVNAFTGIEVERKLPAPSAFNHVIARATINGETYWLDGTRTGDGLVDSERVPNFYWGLPLRPAGAELVALKQPVPRKPLSEMTLEVDARAGIQAPAPARGVMVLRGESGGIGILSSTSASSAMQDAFYKAAWADVPGLEPKLVTATRDSQTGETRIEMVGVMKLFWGGGENGRLGLFLPQSRVGRLREFKRDAGEDQTLPFALSYPQYDTRRITIRLPQGGEGFKAAGADIDRTVAGQQLFRRTRLVGDTVTIETSQKSLVEELSAADATAANPAIKEMGAQLTVLEVTPSYRITSGDADAWLELSPDTAAGYVRRASVLLSAGRADAAHADVEKALALDSNNVTALGLRGVLRTYKGDLPGAHADLDRAAKLDPRNWSVQQGLGQIALLEERYADAVDAFARAADLAPGNFAAMMFRAKALELLGQPQKALAAYDEILQVDPKRPEAHGAKGELLAQLTQYDKALEELEIARKEMPNDPYPETVRAVIYAGLGRTDDMERAFAASLAQRPTVPAYLSRARYRSPEQVELRLRDVEAAAAIEPGNPAIGATKGLVLSEAGRFKEAAAALEKAYLEHMQDQSLRLSMAEAQLRAGNASLADQTFDNLLRGATGNARALNEICWGLGTVNHRLTVALNACDAALKLRPDTSAYLDSRAFVLLRMGRAEEAVTAYDQALRERPRQAASLYGRGIAKRRLGRTAEGDADLAAARQASALVERDFRLYGLTP